MQSNKTSARIYYNNKSFQFWPNDDLRNNCYLMAKKMYFIFTKKIFCFENFAAKQ